MTELEYSEYLKSETDLEREVNILMLEHHGVKGMSWGDRNGPPYPLSRTKSGAISKEQKKKKASLVSKIKKSRADAKKKKAREAAKKQKAEEKKKTETDDEVREKVKKSTDPSYIYKNRHLLNDNELQDRINRLQKENAMKDLMQKAEQAKKGKSKLSTMKDVEQFLNSSANMAKSLSTMYASYNTISNLATSQKKKKQNNNNNNNNS